MKRIGHGVLMTPKFRETVGWFRDTLGFICSDDVYAGEQGQPDRLVQPLRSRRHVRRPSRLLLPQAREDRPQPSVVRGARHRRRCHGPRLSRAVRQIRAHVGHRPARARQPGLRLLGRPVGTRARALGRQRPLESRQRLESGAGRGGAQSRNGARRRRRNSSITRASEPLAGATCYGAPRQCENGLTTKGQSAMQYDPSRTQSTVLAARGGGRRRRARPAGTRQRAARLARHGPAGARRRLRSDRLCAQSRSGRQAPHRQQRHDARGHRRAAARRLRSERDREARHLPDDQRANAPVNIFVHGGAWRANRAADYAFLAEPFVNAGAHYVILDFTNVDDAAAACSRWSSRCAAPWPGSTATPGASAATRPALSELALLRLASRRLRRDSPTGQGGLARRHPQGRDAQQRHVRSQAGAAVETLKVRQVHRRDGGSAERAAPSSTSCTLRSSWPMAPTRRRNFSARRAISAPRSKPPASRSRCSSARATIISRCSRRLQIPTAFSAARFSRRWGSRCEDR